MGRPIARRDILHGGAALALLGAAPEATSAAPQDRPGYDPPALTGLRGSHPGSFEVAHSLRDGTFWKDAPAATPDEAAYDLVVVGGGIRASRRPRSSATRRPVLACSCSTITTISVATRSVTNSARAGASSS